jgi:hypothetical protein
MYRRNFMNEVMSNKQWKEYLQEGQAHAAQSMLAYCVRIAEYKAICEVKQGGSTFSQDCDEWLGLSQPSSNKLALIGENDKLIHSVNKLPQSWGTLYELTTLSDEQFDEALRDGDIHPDMTRKDVKAIKQGNIKEIKPISFEDKPFLDQYETIMKYTDKMSVERKRWLVTELVNEVGGELDEVLAAQSMKVKMKMLRAAMQELHPDKGGDDALMFVRVKEIYEEYK